MANSDFDFEMVDEEDARTDPSSRQEPSGQTFFDLEIRAQLFAPEHHFVSREERQMVLAGTRNARSTELWLHSCGVLGMTRTIVMETEEASVMERQVAMFILQTLTTHGLLNRFHMASWPKEPRQVCRGPYDPDEAIWCCGVLHPTISEPEVVDWDDDWSPQESTPFVEDVTSGQSQTLALSPDDVMPARCVHQAEALAVGAPRTLAQARTAVAVVKRNSQRFLSSIHRSCQSQGQEDRHARSSRFFSWELQWSFGSELRRRCGPSDSWSSGLQCDGDCWWSRSSPDCC